MSDKLDEIEAEFRACGSDEADAEWKQDWGELLIQAVRQLGAIVRERESKSITASRIEHGSLDPDVLELIPAEEGNKIDQG